MLLGMSLTSILVVAFLSLALKLLDSLWLKPKKLEKLLRQQGLKGNPYRPFLGDLKDYAAAMKPKSIALSEYILPHAIPYYHHCVSKHGENSFMWFGPWPRLNITDPELINEILKRNDAFHKPFPEIVKEMSGGLTALEGEKWANHRKIVAPAFYMEKLKIMGPTMALCCSKVVENWKSIISCSDGGHCEIDIWPCMEDLTVDVISRVAFGTSHEEAKQVCQLLKQNIKFVFDLAKFSFIPGWRHLPVKTIRKTKAITDEIESRLIHIIDKKRKTMERDEEATPRDDLLSVLIRSSSQFIQEHGRTDAGLGTQDIIEECKLFYLSGSGSTSGALTWTMLLLSRHPDWQTRAREEVMTVFGKSQPTFEGLHNLKIVNMIIKESLRLYPPGPFTIRSCIKPVKIGDLTIPAGVHITLLIGMVHYDSKLWGYDAKEFNPQRFSKGVSNASNNPYSYIPFGLGPRNCPGQNYVMTELKMALAFFLQSFVFELSPSYVHSPFTYITMSPQHGAPLIFRNL